MMKQYFAKSILTVLIMAGIGCSTLTTPLNNDAIQDISPSDDGSQDTLSPQVPDNAPIDTKQYISRRIGDPEIILGHDDAQLIRLRLVATNFVSTLLQIPEIDTVSDTFQVASPISAFGAIFIRVLEQGGFALQMVSSDQGKNYISYGQRFSNTDTGPVMDFNVSINQVELTREFSRTPDGIFPTSLMNIRGTQSIETIDVIDDPFTEQGVANESDVFISGAISNNQRSSPAYVSQVRVNSYDKVPLDKRRTIESILQQARVQAFRKYRMNPGLLDDYIRYRRSVFIFENSKTIKLGTANKQASLYMARQFEPGDLFIIQSCTDVDGFNNESEVRALRVWEELILNGIPSSSISTSPCTRTSYRHPADTSAVPVEIVLYRPKSKEAG